ncbi:MULTISPECIES: hypothetical protein [Borreliella]|uniref:Uncharacterized protein n=1 Tax=Borreliella valaisiana VS116 TaxID=445987 RepID=C0R8J1_BORVA|nr:MULTISPECIES: hypothetical protein [Borreliella]ACN52757.1 hypothetical protein BVAVS116_Q0036 [Borreliella valaisiana VS116]MCS2182136.1 hypothetical protein [Borreliella burgdorferi]
MNKKMFIICAVFALIISCKNYASGEDLKQNVKEQVKGFLDTKKEELTEGIKILGSEVSSKVGELMQADEPQGQLQHQVAQDVNNVDQEVEKLKKELEDLKKKVDGTNDKTTLETYSGYEKELEKLEEELKKKLEELKDKLKDKKEDKEKLEKELKELKEKLKEKKEKRKKALEETQKKFKGYQRQVESAGGVTHGAQAKNKGGAGKQAWSEASKLGLLDRSYSTDTDTSDMSSGIIEGALQKIEEELKEIEEESKGLEQKKNKNGF